jgi:YVTN family beta-propeller protein
VANYESGTVSVIDTSTNTVVATVPVGSEPLRLAVTPSRGYVYVANDTGAAPTGTVSVIKTSTNTVVNTVSVNNGPDAIAIS